MTASMFEALFENPRDLAITGIFVALLLILFVVACVRAYRDPASRLADAAPVLLTSGGILGTFLGVLLGLLEFNPALGEIETSIGRLIEGLKTAFITSVAGMTLGVFFKLLRTSDGFSGTGAPGPEGPQPGHFLDVLKKQNELLESTKKVIAGDEESSLAGRMKLIHSDLREWNDENRKRAEGFQAELWRQFSEFSEMLSKAATEQVVEALRSVIADFNQQLNEQFGDNFKKLNAAVEKLVDWQDRYRQQLIELHEHYTQSVEAVKTIERAVARIAESTESIPTSMQRLEDVVGMTKQQIDELGEHIDAFRVMRDRAVEAIPSIQAQVTEMVTQIGHSVQAATAQQETLAVDLDVFTKKQDAEMTRLTKAMTDFGQRVQRDMQAVQEEVGQSTTQIMETTKEAVDTLLREETRRVDRLNTEIQQLVRRKFEFLNSETEKEVVRVMNEFGRSLTQIARKFSDYYGGLADTVKGGRD